MAFYLFLISIFSSAIGAITGIGGGIIIKPVVDALGVLSVLEISFLSGCTVLSMSVVSLIRSKSAGVKIDFKRASFLAVGAAFGGISGKIIFDLIAKSSEAKTGIYQAAVLAVLTVLVIFYMLFKGKIKAYNIKNKGVSLILGVVLGLASAFLGIGGGPINLMFLYLLFSFETKEASINSLFIIFFSQLASLVFSYINGSIPSFSPFNLIFMILGGVLGGLIGSSLLKRLTSKGVEKVFIFILAVIVIICIYNIKKFITVM